MIKIAALLIGRRHFGTQWLFPLAAAMLMTILAFGIVANPSGWLSRLAMKGFGLTILVWGAGGLFAVSGKLKHRSIAGRIKPCFLIGFGALVLASPTGRPAALDALLAAALLLDGVSRLLPLMLVRYTRWTGTVLAIAGEVSLAAAILCGWPLPQIPPIPLCVSLLIVKAAATLLRLSLFLRRTSTDVSIHASPLFQERNWNEDVPATVTATAATPPTSTTALRILIWMPAGALDEPRRLPLIDRYLMAFDRSGKPSMGHSALEALPDIYVSHWPVKDIDAGLRELPHVFFAGTRSDVAGLFPPSYAFESADWRPADAVVEFSRFDADRLRAYWQAYRLSSTYNVTNRNCSIAVATALETALEGSLGGARPMLRLALLLFTPSLWQAAYLRSRAEQMCWTPGMVLDYARALQRIVDPARAGLTTPAGSKTRDRAGARIVTSR